MTRPIPRSPVHRWLSTPLAIVVIVASMLIPATSVAAAEPTDMVLEWNINTVATIGNPPTATPPGLGQPPPLSPLHIGMVHGAIYDAVMAIVGTHEPLVADLAAPADASQAAAVAAAARGVLLGITPDTSTTVEASINALYASSLSRIPDGAAEAAGIAVGEAAAAAMLADRTGDGRFGTYTFPVGDGPGEWQLVPPLNANAFGWVANVRPFTLLSQDQFRIGAPFPLDSPEYAAEFNEVKTLGGASSVRTPAQAALATFASANPVPAIHRALREIAVARGLSTGQQARLFAMTTIATADALIACWENKDHWLFWRPQTAIQQADSDGNPATVADPTWTSLIPTPGYPDPPSGFNCVVASSMWAARGFFGTNSMTFSLTSVGATPITRHYRQFSGPIKDAIDGRVLVGLHFRRADEQGAWLGKKVATWLTHHAFGPAD